MADAQKIGALIAALRKKKNLTQGQLAERLGVTNKAVSKWETGAGIPDVSILPALCAVLGVTADELLRGDTRQLSACAQLACGEKVACAPDGAVPPMWTLQLAQELPAFLCAQSVRRSLQPLRKRELAVLILFGCAVLLFLTGSILLHTINSVFIALVLFAMVLLVIDKIGCGVVPSFFAFLRAHSQPQPLLEVSAIGYRLQQVDSLCAYAHSALRAVFVFRSCLVLDFCGSPVTVRRPGENALAELLAQVTARTPAASVVIHHTHKRRTFAFVAAFLCTALLLGAVTLRAQGVWASVSPSGKLAVLRVDPKTGVGTWYRHFGTQKSEFAYFVAPDTELKLQWLTQDACAVTYIASVDNLAHQSVITCGDRATGAYSVINALPGVWRNSSKGTFLMMRTDNLLIGYNGRVYSYSPSDCVQFGTIALVVCHDGLPQFTVVLGEDIAVEDAGTGTVTRGSVVVCPVNARETQPATLRLN